MNTLRFLFVLSGLCIAAVPVTAAAPFRLFEVGVTRFVKDDNGQGRVQNGRLSALGAFTLVASTPSGFVALVPESALGKNLIFTEAWHAYGELGSEARANFRLANNGAPITIGSLIYYEVQPDPEARLDVGNVVNLSTRGRVEAGGVPTLIGGFVIQGMPRRVLVRAIGPSLKGYGVDDALSDPFVSIQRGNTTIFFNGDWGARHDADATEQAATQVGAFPIARNSKDAALVVELPPGLYSASVVSETGASGGTALLEIYVMP